MAQSATQKRTPLGIESFWDKPSSDPPLKWENWQMQAKLALLAKENITLDTLLEPKPDTVQLPLEPIYEDTITGSSAQSERERLARNTQSKMNWENRCQRQLEIGVMCGDKPWAQADRKTVSMLYLRLGTEGGRIVCSRNPHLKMDILTTAELWTIMESAFIRQRNITFDRYVLLTAKQTRGESIERFFEKLKELSENCELGSQEDTLIRDLFIANMLDPEIQKELLRETLEPAQALRLAINMELGQRNQLKITNSQPAPQVNAVIFQRPSRPPSQRLTTSSFTRPPNQLCRNCGLTWSANHKVKCIARDKTCNNCGLQNHFSRVCRKPKSSSNKPIQSNVNSVEETSTDQTVNAIQNMNYNPQCESDYDSSDDNMVASIASNAIQIEPKNTILQIGNTQVGLLIDSGSVCSILPESLPSEIVENSPLARWLMIAPPQELKTISNEPINVTGMIQAPIASNGWRLEEAEFVVVRDGLKPLVGRDLFDALGISVTQTPKHEGSMVNTITSQCPFKTRIAKQFPQPITRIGRSKIHIVKSKFHRNFQLKHQKGRRVPINLQERVKNEIKKLLEEGHIEKLNNCSDPDFISPIVITVKRDQTIKLALDSRTLNKSIHKNKYQMPNFETLMDSISQIISNYKIEPADKIYFSTIDLKYAYSQLNLHPETAKHCNFNIVSGDMTGTYRSKRDFMVLLTCLPSFKRQWITL